MFLLRTPRALPKPTSSFRSSSISITRGGGPAFSTTALRFNSSDYGSGDANPEHSRSQETKDAEHPGPAPPSTGGSSSGGKEASSRGQAEKSSGGEKSEDKPQPKILNASHPKEGEESEDVKKHNEDMKQNRENQGAKKPSKEGH
ncbi:unnamed protein product [Zymoseptoria tritici ST99CH_1A5]|uniref:Uncharacterized protein n=2 Tax=Zymoseptoria tritici TaxID=1047171 RepID=F9X5Y7_ZYMTI|nr:uncharacterized protein MYCGRDRAFT_79756 [Zymoseptoria tritici IPO323]EGP89625.1 hypothetical protein MYCGRDRAFT_79756 [Zymoseptoria tritici IPO323]SMY22063.1 unnamed protein product [Zymoseptoria tritici ST99CH_1A5]